MGSFTRLSVTDAMWTSQVHIPSTPQDHDLSGSFDGDPARGGADDVAVEREGEAGIPADDDALTRIGLEQRGGVPSGDRPAHGAEVGKSGDGVELALRPRDAAERALIFPQQEETAGADAE